VILATCDRSDAGSVVRYEKTVSNIEGFKKQGSPIIAVATEGDERIPQLAAHTIFVPEAPELLSPILEIVPLQIFAYYMAVYRGLDVDRPRNLTKSVTVE
jgi:glutamine---fructose-6-phosphate transaminase (isomerizing)